MIWCRTITVPKAARCVRVLGAPLSIPEVRATGSSFPAVFTPAAVSPAISPCRRRATFGHSRRAPFPFPKSQAGPLLGLRQGGVRGDGLSPARRRLSKCWRDAGDYRIPDHSAFGIPTVNGLLGDINRLGDVQVHYDNQATGPTPWPSARPSRRGYPAKPPLHHGRAISSASALRLGHEPVTALRARAHSPPCDRPRLSRPWRSPRPAGRQSSPAVPATGRRLVPLTQVPLDVVSERSDWPGREGGH